MRRMQATLAIAALFAGVSGGSANAAGTVGNKSIRCLMLSNLYVNSAKDDQGRQAAAATRLFYLGRISDSLTQAQLEAAMLAEGKTIEPATAGIEMNRCAQVFTDRSKAMETITQKLRQQLSSQQPAK